jgi:predicted nucleic acid-binding protein
MRLPKLNPPTVFIDATFLRSLVDPTSPRHADATMIYRDLVHQFRDERVLLVAAHTTLAEFSRPVRTTLLAPIATVHVARSYRSAGGRMVATTTSSVADDDLALDIEFATQLVLLQRERIDRAASFDTRFERFDITLEQATALSESLSESLSGSGGYNNAE